ncbi:MAG: SxtJ family membrane protein [Melioribacteraceae bacterium]
MLNYFVTKISKKQAVDTGLAMMLISFIVAYFTGKTFYLNLMLPVLLIIMIYPKMLYPFAVVWLSLSKILGTFISKIILTFVFFIMVVPMGLFRKILGKDSLQLKDFKKDKTSVFKTRNYNFSSEDLEKPF